MSKLKAVFFDLDDTLYTSFQAGDRYAYEMHGKVGAGDLWRGRTRLRCRVSDRKKAARCRAAGYAADRTTACCLRSVRWKTWV